MEFYVHFIELIIMCSLRKRIATKGEKTEKRR